MQLIQSNTSKNDHMIGNYSPFITTSNEIVIELLQNPVQLPRCLAQIHISTVSKTISLKLAIVVTINCLTITKTITTIYLNRSPLGRSLTDSNT